MTDFNGKFVKLKGIDNARALPEFRNMLLSDEDIAAAFDGAFGKVVFTNLRIIASSSEGISGVKLSYFTFPYKNIQAFSIETAGAMDRVCSLDILTGGVCARFDFSSGVDILRLSQILSYYIL